MKYISFIIPCYNSSEYMRKCIDSCLTINDDAEILIIDDGSTKDNTYEIAKEYEEKYPDTCRAIHKENGGHGSVLNLGIKEATGLYTKVVDSDDWLDEEALKYILDKIKMLENDNSVEMPDLIISNFIYDKVGQVLKKTMKYTNLIPIEKVVTWDQIKNFTVGHYLLMHALMYKTEVLKSADINLPEHTFYVDNIYAYKPLPYVKTLYYVNKDLYHYYIGRIDQSVNESIMISRLDQQYRVTYAMINETDLNKVESKKCKHYMVNYLSIIMTVTSVLSILSKDENRIVEKNNLWKYLKNKDSDLYKKLRYCFLGMGVNLPGKIGDQISAGAYKIVQSVYGFN